LSNFDKHTYKTLRWYQFSKMETPPDNTNSNTSLTLKHIYVLAILIMTVLQSAKAQNSTLDIGIRLQKDIGLYSENGISINFSDKNLLPDRLYFGFTYVTSRTGTAFSSNAIKQDNFLFSPAYYFRHNLSGLLYGLMQVILLQTMAAQYLMCSPVSPCCFPEMPA